MLLIFILMNHIALVPILAGAVLLMTDKKAIYLGFPIGYTFLWSGFIINLTFTSEAMDIARKMLIWTIYGYFIPGELVMSGIFVYIANLLKAKEYLVVAMGWIITIVGNIIWTPTFGTGYHWIARSFMALGSITILIGFILACKYRRHKIEG